MRYRLLPALAVGIRAAQTADQFDHADATHGDLMLIEHTSLTKIASAILAKAGAPEEQADAVAKHLVEANLKGHDSHGVGMIPS